MIQLQHYSSVAACSGYTSRDSVYCCAYARMHVHASGTHYVILRSTYFATTNYNSSINSSAAAASCVFCCSPYPIYRRIDSGVLLLVDLNGMQ